MTTGQLIPGVSNNELTRTSWANFVANELNVNSLKLNGKVPGAAGPSATAQVMTGPLIINATPGLQLRGTSPFLQWESAAGTPVRYGYMQGTASGLLVVTDAGSIRYQIGAVEIVEMASGLLKVSGAGRFANTTGNQVQVVDANGGGAAAVATVGFYPSATSVDAPGARGGYLGFNGTANLAVVNEQSNGSVRLLSNGAGDILLDAATAGVIAFTTANTERGRVDGVNLLWGKAGTNLAAAGVEVNGTGRVASTTGIAGAPNLYLRHVGGADADGQFFAQFADASGGFISAITQDSTAPVGVNFVNCTATAPSDYRLKNDLGPVTDPAARLLELVPRHLSWIAGGAEFDGFFAHEVQAVVPGAVTGDKDQVYDADEAAAWGVDVGAVKPQQLDVSALVPLLTAALQAALAEISALSARLDALEVAS